MFDANHGARKMRTTLTIDDDVLAAAKGLAVRQNKTVGEVISALSRQALRPKSASAKVRNGVPLLPVRARTRAGDAGAGEPTSRRAAVTTFFARRDRIDQPIANTARDGS
jgi:hypothetical protein